MPREPAPGVYAYLRAMVGRNINMTHNYRPQGGLLRDTTC